MVNAGPFEVGANSGNEQANDAFSALWPEISRRLARNWISSFPYQIGLFPCPECVLKASQSKKGYGAMGSLVVGRDGSCDVVLDDSSVSRWHVKLDVDEQGACRLTDLGSTNGTFVFRDREPVGVLEALVTLADRVKIGKRDFSVHELVSLARGRQSWTQEPATVKSTESLWRNMGDNSPEKATKHWRSSSALAFVVGFSVIFWLAVLYFLVGF